MSDVQTRVLSVPLVLLDEKLLIVPVAAAGLRSPGLTAGRDCGRRREESLGKSVSVLATGIPGHQLQRLVVRAVGSAVQGRAVVLCPRITSHQLERLIVRVLNCIPGTVHRRLWHGGKVQGLVVGVRSRIFEWWFIVLIRPTILRRIIFHVNVRVHTSPRLPILLSVSCFILLASVVVLCSGFESGSEIWFIGGDRRVAIVFRRRDRWQRLSDSLIDASGARVSRVIDFYDFGIIGSWLFADGNHVVGICCCLRQPGKVAQTCTNSSIF